MTLLKHKKFIFLAGILLFLFLVSNAYAANVGDIVNFNIEKSFDVSNRDRAPSSLVKITNSLYFYIEKSWWDAQTPQKQEDILTSLNSLSDEFDSNIYPKLTSTFGFEMSPGIDGDRKITVLFTPMNSAEGGYFNTADEYEKLQITTSNEREMVYLSVDELGTSQAKVVLAHEFMHLITFNQKNKIFDIEDDTWLNEARADYSSTFLGYDDVYEGSNLQQRVRDFVANPTDSLTEWTGTKYDYAIANLFAHYLVDHYGISVLAESLKSKYIGVSSINYALSRLSLKDDFKKIFTNWTIASVINNCSTNTNYCYLNGNLKSLRISPTLNFLPITGNVSLSVANVTKNWQGNWLKFIGGNGDLELGFSGLKGLNFQVPYIIEDSSGSQTIKMLTLDEDQKGKISVANFGKDYKSIIIIPSLQSEISSAVGEGTSYPFTYSVSITGEEASGEQALIQKLLDQIAYLKAEIAKLLGYPVDQQTVCGQLNTNLSMGDSGSSVKCLQTFLKSQGSDIYPEGLVTGYFGNLTKAAVTKFQQKYASEILSPLGLSYGTGYVGALTRVKINQLGG
jgi:hypothetical protein